MNPEDEEQADQLEDAETLAQAPGDEDLEPPVKRARLTLLSLLRRAPSVASVSEDDEPDEAQPVVVFIPGCSGKVRYPSKSVALVMASRYLRIDRSDRPAPLGLRSYWCRHCYGWHLTSKV